MKREVRTRLIREGDYLAEVDVELLYDVDAWSPHLSLDDALKIDRVRSALRNGEIEVAANDARLFEVLPRRLAGHV